MPYFRGDVVVLYDDVFDRQFGRFAPTRVRAVMEIVNEMYSERDSLKTTIKWNIISIQHLTGKDWASKEWNLNEISAEAAKQTIDADIYVFMTGQWSLSGLGVAYLGTACGPKETRININKYIYGGFKNGDAYTAEVG